jgi:hypothetical protein
MTTPGTKTRALCVATRCTTVDQFVSTFHRFCGDDQTFFVATLTSRPVGLETAFAIQLADKQPVLRGMCVVLDAWATPDNAYKRPGIRLGIKRLTPDSETVFERLRAAARAPVALAEATPPSGSPPVSSSQPLAVVTTSTQPLPPALPALAPPPPLAPPPGATALPALAPPPGATALPALAPPPGATALPAIAPPPARRPGTPPPVPQPVAPRAGLPSVRTVAVPEVKPLADARPVDPPPAPIAVTRFQVALNVDTIPPPISDVEFKPSLLIPRPRPEPRIISTDPDDGDDLAAPAVIVDRPSGAELAPPVVLAPPPEQRTPGSDLILPANPLHNLSDESLEGFVDCTIYEETGNFFHPGADGAGWSDELADPPAAPLSTVPAMPFDEPPVLAVRAVGDTESLRVAPPEVHAPERPYAPRYPTVAFVPPPAAPLLDGTGAHPALAVEPGAYPPVEPGAYPPVEPRAHPPAEPGAYPPVEPGAYPSVEPGAYPPVDPRGYPPFAAPGYDAVSLPAHPPPPRAWLRSVAIGASAVVAIVVAIGLARMVRGRAESADAVARAAPPAAVVAKPAARPRTAAPIVRADPPAVADAVAPDEDGEAAAGGAPVVGHGPCRFTVATTPAGSAIRLDDQPMGVSPLTIDTTCDKHKLDASHARYQAVSRTIALEAGKPTELDVSLPRPTHSVTVTSTPPGAELSIDGHRAGTTPTVVQMMGFATVNLTFTKPGYRTVTRKVYSKLAQDRVAVQLAR